MSDLQLIEGTLRRAARRRRWERAFYGFWRGLLVGAALWLAALAAYKLFPLPVWSLYAAAGVGLLAAVMGLIIGGWRKTSLTEIARWIDGKQHLQERLGTALELAQSPNSGAWRDLILTDATAHVQGLDLRRLVQFRLPKASRWALLLLALCAGLGFVPEYRSKSFVQQQTDKKNIQEAGRQLLNLTRQSLQKRPPALETTEKSMDAVSDLGERLSKASLTRGDALKDLTKVTDTLQDQLNDLSKDPSMQRMEQAARAAGGETSPEAARLQKQIEETQKQLGNATGTPEAMDKLQKELSKIQEAARAAADKNGNMSQADKEKISQSLSALSRQAQEMGLQNQNLDDAIQALAANQTDMFLKDLSASVNDLQKTRDLAKSLQQMRQQMDKLGKDLAEQLKNGQAEAAQDTLQKMAQQLKSSNLTPEQMQKLMRDVANAIQAGNKYGKVGDLLKSAMQQMKQGQNANASKSLSAASDELKKMMAQMGDAQSLAAELDALNKASLSVGTGQSWAKCNKPGVGKGGKPGSGVGTWADEDSGWGYDGHVSDRWDNSGVFRPDQTPKGLTDRGDPDQNDALKPTKVKGQFSPGGQMPSITLKGVSIKGESKVAYEESAVAAQADAQSALSQEKVPRAYQGAVKDYFDDLKQ